MEIAKLEAIYTADDRGLERVSARADSRFKQTTKEAEKTEKAVSHAFKNPPAGLSQSLSTVNQKVSSLSGSMLSLRDIAAGVFAGFSISAAVSQIQQAASAVLTFKSNLETSQIAFTTMLGSIDLANQHLKELQQFALTTPFEFEGLVDASKRMQAMGFEARQIIPILTDVGNAVAAVGGRRDTLDRVVLALSQIQAKGKVAAQEMNQLAEAGIPAWRLLAETLGVSRAEAIKLAEEGKISGKVFLDAFQKFSQTNFGGMMEKQSRTFAGAMSNIKDVLLQTAGTAFDPLFRNISQITDRMAQELASGKPTLEQSFKILLDGLVEMAGTAGGQIADTLISKITDPRKWAIAGDDPFFIDALLRGIFSGLPGPEELFTGRGVPEIPALKVPDLRVPLNNLTTGQKQTTEGARKAQEVFDDLALKLAFYGQNTEVAATKQRLLAIGMDALTSAEGRRAIQLAELIDKQRTANALDEQRKQFTKDLTAITEGKFRNAFETLLQTSQDTRLEIMELMAAEAGGLSALDRFNLGLGAQVEGMMSAAQAAAFTAEQLEILRIGLVNARTAMQNLTLAQEDAKRKAEIKRLGEQRTELLRSLAGVDVALSRQLRRTPADEVQRLAEQLEGLSSLKILPGGLDLFVEKLRAGSIDAQTALAEIGTAISGAAGDLGGELPGVTDRIVNLFLKARELMDLFARDEATTRYKDVLASLQDVIQGDIHLTNAQRVEKLLLSDAYKSLTEAQIESLRQTAQEADLAQRLRVDREAHMQSMREVAEDVGAIFGDLFDSITGDWRDMWRDMARIGRSIARQLFQELMTGFASRGLGLPFTSQAGGIVGLLSNSLFNNRPASNSGFGSVGGVGGGLAALAGSRAFGGPVEAGNLYRINERGMEFFKPNIGGQVIPIGKQDQASREMRIGIFDSRERMDEWRPDRVLRAQKQMRKLGKLVSV